MTTFQLSGKLVLLALVILISACSGGNPNKPEPTCTDPKATNVGQPLPCTFPPVAPAQSFVQVVSTSPQAGATLKATVVDAQGFLKGEEISVTLRYALSDADWAKTRERGENVIVSVCLSVDGQTVLDFCSGRYASMDGRPGENVQSGQISGLTLMVMARDNVKLTNYFIVYLKWRDKDHKVTGRPDEPFYQNPVQMVFKWE